MKTSPLTADEKACINEGIILFKHDWPSICKFFVPHRDPSLLPRQWRIATGTQKSYKKSDALKEKRRLYDAKRRKVKASTADCKTSSTKEIDNETDSNASDTDGENESYVHEAFLTELEPGSSRSMYYETPLSRNNLQPTNIVPNKSSHISECGESQRESGNIHKLLNFSKTLKDMHPSNFSWVGYSSSLPSNSTLRSSRGQLIEEPFQQCKKQGVRIVKLAPDLPPVNLPSSVRVVSQSAFKNYHCESSYAGNGDSAVKNLFPRFSQLAKSGSSIQVPAECMHKFSDDDLETSCQPDGGSLAHQITEEDTTESDLHMHPLLFQASEDQLLAYLSTSCHTTASSTYSFFQGNLLQTEPVLFRAQNSIISNDPTDATSHLQEPSKLCTIDFHPLLQRTDNNNSSMSSSVALLSGGVSSQSKFDKFLNPSDYNLRVPLADNNGEVVTGIASISPYEKESNLDLDICLCSSTDKGKTKGRDMSGHNSVAETILKLGNRMAEKGTSADVPFLNFNEKLSADSVAKASSSQSVACPGNDIHSIVLPLCTGGSFQNTGGPHDEPMPEIVMEQEELSDSEEEIEHVEFECEEIDDSEGEDLSSEQPTFQKKEILVFSSNKEAIQATHDLQQLHEPRTAQKSTRAGKNCAGPIQGSEGSCHAKLLRVKSKRKPLKKKGSSSFSSMPTACLSRSSKKRNVASSEPHPLMVQSKYNASTKARKHSS